ncbi:nucleotide sugar dehydrogenase [Candidatus Peregrinibacteria bacterium]|nr:nucleotide sugar dehydrogenase [Candidatus Peregrinibacteria bacterium]
MHKPPLCVVGLGYVGLPLAAAFARKGYVVYGYDINRQRIEDLKRGHDRTRELSAEELNNVRITYSDDPAIIQQASVIIIAMPTPVDGENKPDLSMLEHATQTVGQHLQKGAMVVYESTVYPGVTEDVCGPILERASGLRCGVDFTLGYSPERINPGDREHTVKNIVKVVAGQDEKTRKALAMLYGSIIEAGIHEAPSIKVAEMAKAIENAQRDLNIAYINEVAMMCTKMDIRTADVLAAASTKWNFLRFQPGLVGGHCIGVDPYYLVWKARQLGMATHVITAGRTINESMGCFVAEQILSTLQTSPAPRILVLGLTFKENVPDTRNSKSPDVIRHLTAAGCAVEVHDPYVHADAVRECGWTAGSLDSDPYDAVVLLVPHREYLADVPGSIIRAAKVGGLIYDLKSVLDRKNIEKAGKKYLAL